MAFWPINVTQFIRLSSNRIMHNTNFLWYFLFCFVFVSRSFTLFSFHWNVWLSQFINNLLCKLQTYQSPNGNCRLEINFMIIDFHSESNAMIQIAIDRQQKMKFVFLFGSGGIIQIMIVIRSNVYCEAEQVKLSDGGMNFRFEYTKNNNKAYH